MAPADLIMQGQLHASPNANDLALAIIDINNQLIAMNNAKHSFIVLGLYNGSTKTHYRKYVDPITSRIPMVAKTRHTITGPVQLFFRCPDPGIYQGTSESDTIVVTSGSGSKAITGNGNLETKRMTLLILKTGGTNPSNVTIENGVGGPSFSIAGSLTVPNSYWKVDLYTTEVVKGVPGNPVTDESGSFTGERFPLQPGSNTIVVTDGGSASFSVALAWVGRFQ